MLNEQKKQILNQFLDGLSKEQIAWASGYLAGYNGVSEKSLVSNTIWHWRSNVGTKFSTKPDRFRTLSPTPIT